jgi:transposase
LATNLLETAQLSNDDVLSEYKAQQSTERGFRFLKDPLFFTSSVFLNSTERVAALAMLMGLCLLVYSLGQRALRQALERVKTTIDNQLGKPTSTPTLR